MPEPNDNKIEDLLKTYAAKRRQDATPPELHPVNRRLLQEEVSRTYGTKGKNPDRSRWASIRFWLPFAATVSVFVAVVGLILARQPTPTSSRQSSDAPPASRAASKPATTAPPVPEAKSSADSVELKLEPAIQPQQVLPPGLSGARNSSSLESAASLAVAPATPAATAQPRLDRALSRGMSLGREEQVAGNDKDQPKLSLARPVPEPAERSILLQRQDPPQKPDVRLALEDRTSTGSLTFGGGATPGASAGGSMEKESLTLNRQSPVARSAVAIAASGRAASDALMKLAPGQAPVTPALQTADGPVAAKLPMDQYSNSVRQRFQRTTANYRSNLNSPRPPNILNSFEFVQEGNQVQVIEPDGSAYKGQVVQSPPAVESAITKLGASARPGSAANRDALQSPKMKSAEPDGLSTNQTALYFRVTGTNKTLKRLVVFDGNVTQLPDAQSENTSLKQIDQNRFQFKVNDSSILSNSRIQGQATYGNKQSLEINAISAPQTK